MEVSSRGSREDLARRKASSGSLEQSEATSQERKSGGEKKGSKGVTVTKLSDFLPLSELWGLFCWHVCLWLQVA